MLQLTNKKVVTPTEINIYYMLYKNDEFIWYAESIEEIFRYIEEQDLDLNDLILRQYEYVEDVHTTYNIEEI